MTESEWLKCGNPERLFRVLQDQGGASERKPRLLACACVRRIWAALPSEPCGAAIEAAERHADGLADWEELGSTALAAKDAARSGSEPDPPDVVAAELALSAVEQLAGHTDPWECVRGASE